MNNKARSTPDAVRRIRKHKPKNQGDFDKIGVELESVPFSGGSFRNVYHTTNKKLRIVVKFPVIDNDSTHSGIVHSRAEVRKINKLSRFKLLKPHLPKVYYHDDRTGIVVMKKYSDFPNGSVSKTTLKKLASSQGL